MRKSNLIICTVVLVCLLAGCTITGRISRRQTTVGIEHSMRHQREYLEERRAEAEAERNGEAGQQTRRGYIEYTRADNSKLFIVPTVTTSDGEAMMQLTIPEVVVSAQARSIPERNGRVSLDFVVTLPKELMGACRGVEVVPMLHKRNGDAVPLRELTIRGALFDKVQQRNYWQYDRYLDLFSPDETGRQRAYERFIHYPYPQGVRLDSVVANKSSISYFYRQEIPVAEAEGNRLQVTLQGRVAALDHSEYRFPLSDTLDYNISSMLSFVDTTARYVTRIIEKYAVVNDRNRLDFRVNSSDIIDTLGDNAAQLARIEGLMDAIINQREFHIDSIILTASASPEGSVARNNRLARDRAYSLRKHLAAKFRGTGAGVGLSAGASAGIDSLITVRWVGEDWAELERLIKGDDKIKHREIIATMLSEVGGDKDYLEREIRARFPDDYRYLLDVLYPRLRAVSFRYHLRRVGMLKDTIHTTVPDTLYARGVKLLKGRRYHEALAVLGGFYNRNAAICMLSLGLDAQAYNTLKALPENSTHCYLLAVTCVRLGLEDEALQHFRRAVELNGNLRYRGRLDPEIAPLLERLPDDFSPQ